MLTAADHTRIAATGAQHWTCSGCGAAIDGGHVCDRCHAVLCAKCAAMPMHATPTGDKGACIVPGAASTLGTPPPRQMRAWHEGKPVTAWGSHVQPAVLN